MNLMAEALIAVRDGRQKRLIFNLPPGHMKSLTVSGTFHGLAPEASSRRNAFSASATGTT